jgi:hypothetical protein
VLIGMLTLVRIVVTDANMLIGLVNQYRCVGQELLDALVEGGAAAAADPDDRSGDARCVVAHGAGTHRRVRSSSTSRWQ